MFLPYWTPSLILIDTANCYNQGKSEGLIGEWMESRGVSDQTAIATKYRMGFQDHDPEIKFPSNFSGNSAKSLHASFRNSVKRLGTTYIDIFYMH